MEKNENIAGKKIFFLYPQDILPNEIIQYIIKNEFEAYIVNDHAKLLNIIKKHNNSILFINIDAVLRQDEWIRYIKTINGSPDTKNICIGVISQGGSKVLKEKFLKQLIIPCGFITFSAGIEKSKDIILKTLIANGAKGRRKYIRIECKNKALASFNANINNKIYTGFIDSISSVGMSCQFEKKNEEIMLTRDYHLNDIQLRLKGVICKISGKVFGIREIEEEKVYVIMFDSIISHESKDKINNFIYTSLQHWIEDELKKA